MLIDYQPCTLFGLRSRNPRTVVNNATALAKIAKAVRVPTIPTSAAAGRVGGTFFARDQRRVP